MLLVVCVCMFVPCRVLALLWLLLLFTTRIIFSLCMLRDIRCSQQQNLMSCNAFLSEMVVSENDGRSCRQKEIERERKEEGEREGVSTNKTNLISDLYCCFSD